MSSNTEHVICMLGMHRSGTSMVSRLLNLCGLYLGPSDRIVSSLEGNPKGHWENTDILNINETLLVRLGGTWDNPPALRSGWESDPVLADIMDRARQLIARDFSSGLLWGWKEPRTTILVPFWKKVVGNLKFVIIVRDLLAVAQSLKARDGIPIRYGSRLWEDYMLRGISDTENSHRLFVFYEDFFADPIFSVRRLLEFCGLPSPENMSHLIADAIDPSLRRQKYTIMDSISHPEIANSARILYVGLHALGRVVPFNTRDKEDHGGDMAFASRSIQNFIAAYKNMVSCTSHDGHKPEESIKSTDAWRGMSEEDKGWVSHLQVKVQHLGKTITERDALIVASQKLLDEKQQIIEKMSMSNLYRIGCLLRKVGVRMMRLIMGNNA